MPIASPFARITPTPRPRPGYLTSIEVAEYGARLTRIGGDTAQPIPVIGGAWHSDSRHGYSRRPFWSRSGKFALMEQRSAPSGPTKLILDGATFAPLVGNRRCDRISKLLEESSEVRWSTNPDHAESVLFAIYPYSLEVGFFDVLEDRELWRMKVPTTLKQLMGEGNLSNDCSVVALGGEDDRVMLIDLVNRRAGPVQTIDFAGLTSNHLGNLTVSPLSRDRGGKVVTKASGSPEYGRVYDFGEDLVLAPRKLRPGLLGAEKAALGIMQPLSHADTGLTILRREVWVGGLRDATTEVRDRGRVIAIDLETGLHWHVTAGRSSGKLAEGLREVADEHCSLRGRPGFVWVSRYATGSDADVFTAEVGEWPLGEPETGAPQEPTCRAAHFSTGDPYRAEVQPCGHPTRPGVCVIASNWAGLGASPASPTSDCKAYVVELVGDAPPPPPPPPPPPAPAYRLAKMQLAEYEIVVDARGVPVHPKDLLAAMLAQHALGEAMAAALKASQAVQP